MATVLYVGKQVKRAGVKSVTVGSSTAAQTFTLTTGNGKAITYTAGSGETTTTIAAALQALFAAATDGEFTELDSGSTPTSNVFNVTGPADGAPFTLTTSGTGTLTIATVTAQLSPYDVSDGLNYSTGALPTAGGVDDLIDESAGTAMLYNAAALTAIDLLSFTRRASNQGGLGLPVTNANGYPEYRTSELEINAPTIRIELNSRDRAGSLRIKSVWSGSAVTATIMGAGGTEVRKEAVEIRGLPASSIVDVSQGSVAIAPYAGQTATVATLLATDSTVRVGSGVTLTNATLSNCQGLIETNYTTLTMIGGGAIETNKAATGSAAGTLVYTGTLTWKSTGGPGNSPVIGSGGAIDFTEAPAAISVGGTVELNAGGSWIDPAGRCGSYSVKIKRCKVLATTFDPGTDKTLAVS